MARILCSKSGIPFNCEHMPLSLSSREYHHPLFSVPKKSLLSLAGQWQIGKLSPTESYLLYLSLFNSTDHLIWRAPACYTPRTAQIIANNMENLLRIVAKIDLIKHPAFVLPVFAISHDTADLTNSYHWIEAWNDNYTDWYEGMRESDKLEELKQVTEKLNTRGQSLESLIKTNFTKPELLAKMLADWAEVAGSFELSDPAKGKPSIPNPHATSGSKSKLSLAEYWKGIIRDSVNEDRIWIYPENDIIELIDHCEDEIDHGSIYAHALMKTLRNGLRKHKEYLGFGDIDLAGRKTTFRVLNPEDSAEDANMISIIASAPDMEPKRSNYPSSFKYLVAKLKWEAKNRHSGKSGTAESNGESS